MAEEIKILNIRVDKRNAKVDALGIIPHLRPEWKKEDIVVEEYSQGIINAMLCIHKRSDTGRRDAIVCRVYGDFGTDSRDRNFEFYAMQIAHHSGCFPPVLACFRNGVAYKFAQGRTLTKEDYIDPSVIRNVSRAIVRFNYYDVTNAHVTNTEGHIIQFPSEFLFFETMWRRYGRIPDTITDPSRRHRFQSVWMPKHKIKEEIALIEGYARQLQLDTALCHMDFHYNNIVYDHDTEQVTFVDFEYSAMGFELQDIANGFVTKPYLEILGSMQPGGPVPDVACQRLWLQRYLQAKVKVKCQECDVTEQHLDNYMARLQFIKVLVVLNWLVFWYSAADDGDEDDFPPGTIQLFDQMQKDYYALKPGLAAVIASCKQAQTEIDNN